jgi:hypothetical protein
MCPHTTVCVSSYYCICVLILLYVSSYYCVCVLILLCMCPHTTVYMSSYYCICVLMLLHLSSCFCVCVLMLLYVSSYYYVSSSLHQRGSTYSVNFFIVFLHCATWILWSKMGYPPGEPNLTQWSPQLAAVCVRILLYRCPHATIYVSSYMCVLILLCMCPHTTACVLILLYSCPHTTMCPHTTINVSSCYYICVLVLLCVCPRTACRSVAEATERRGYVSSESAFVDRKECLALNLTLI